MRITLVCVLLSGLLCIFSGCTNVANIARPTYKPTEKLNSTYRPNTKVKLKIVENRNNIHIYTEERLEVIKKGLRQALTSCGVEINSDSHTVLEITIEEFNEKSNMSNRIVSIVLNARVVSFDEEIVSKNITEYANEPTPVMSPRNSYEPFISRAISNVVDKTVIDTEIKAAIESKQIKHYADYSHDYEKEQTKKKQFIKLKTLGQHWAVVVGVSEYQYAQDGVMGNLVFAQKDADDFYSVLQNQGWAKDHIYKLTNEKANKRNIEYALETWLRKAKPEDMIIVFWSSHAWPDPGDSTKAYFACYDSKPSDPSSGWRMDRVLQILEERNVKNVVMIADTCHAGKIIRAGDPKAIGVIPALEKMNTDRTVPNGWIFIASADSDRKAYEDKAWSNGALTHVLIEGISGQADGYQSLGPKDGSITMGELRGYTTDRMSEESLNILGARLTPLFYTTSGDPGIWNLSLNAK